MDLIREVMLVRYRELYGTTLGDPGSVVRADVGRGVTIYLWNLPPDRRLPLRAYVAGLTLKNGVPINYIEAIGLCEWMEVGFNTFYTFRGGEAGWIYAQVLRCLCHLMGTTCVSVYPYQLGHDNDEAIESGAFWFYRKLGFRPGRPELQNWRNAKKAKSPPIQIPHSRAHAKALGRWACVLRTARKRSGSVGQFFNPQHRIASQPADGARFRRRCRPDARAFQTSAGANARRVTRLMEPLEKAAFENFALVLSGVPRIAAMDTKKKKKTSSESSAPKPSPMKCSICI